jgi:hypothetical protein
VTMVRSACRRDVELANALVSSSNLLGFRGCSAQARDCGRRAQRVKGFS